MMWRSTWLLAVTIWLAHFSSVEADPGQPVAVRWWGQAMVSIETQWNSTVVIDPYGEKIGYSNRKISGDLVLVTHEHGDHNNIELVEGNPVVARGLDESGNVLTQTMIFDQSFDAIQGNWYSSRLRIMPSSHAFKVTSVASWHDNTEGSQRGANAIFLIEIDGVRIVHCGDLGQHKLSDEQLAALGKVDVLLIPVGGVYTVDGAQAAGLVQQVSPRIVVPIHYKTPNLIYDLQGVQGFLEALGEDREVVRAKGNTLAVSTKVAESAKPQAVVLDFLPWKMPQELAALFEAKEKSCRESQAVFAKLSTEQMNFKPSDGTHTPRWNAEHMLGRELGFFSKIYAQLDSSLGHQNLNPKQMPPDYVAAHPDWSGAEEAQQMERVTAFTRRFAYLLDELPLDKKAPGSRWTPCRLLEQMARHYGEHTANVQKKSELADWPEK